MEVAGGRVHVAHFHLHLPVPLLVIVLGDAAAVAELRVVDVLDGKLGLEALQLKREGEAGMKLARVEEERKR